MRNLSAQTFFDYKRRQRQNGQGDSRINFGDALNSTANAGARMALEKAVSELGFLLLRADESRFW